MLPEKNGHVIPSFRCTGRLDIWAEVATLCFLQSLGAATEFQAAQMELPLGMSTEF